MARCLITRALPGPAIDRLAERHELTVWPDRLPPTPRQLREELHRTDAEGLLCTLSDTIDMAALDAAPRLRAIANYAVGTDNLDLSATAARGIPVGNTPDVLTDATADLTFALLLGAARRLPEAIDTVRRGDWRTWEPDRELGVAVHGATLGIIGGGRIGAAVARRAAGFDMEVLIHGRHGPVSLLQLLRRSDFVSLHCPLTHDTHHLIDADALAQMKSSAILINTARGPIVDQCALARALHDGTIAGAALDVTDPEPPPDDDPLLQSPHLILVPHIGSATRQAREAMTELSVENLLAGLDGTAMPHPVEPAP